MIKLTKRQSIPFLYEMLEELVEAATFYGMAMETRNEELAAHEYEAARLKLYNAMAILLPLPEKT